MTVKFLDKDGKVNYLFGSVDYINISPTSLLSTMIMLNQNAKYLESYQKNGVLECYVANIKYSNDTYDTLYNFDTKDIELPIDKENIDLPGHWWRL